MRKVYHRPLSESYVITHGCETRDQSWSWLLGERSSSSTIFTAIAAISCSNHSLDEILRCGSHDEVRRIMGISGTLDTRIRIFSTDYVRNLMSCIQTSLVDLLTSMRRISSMAGWIFLDSQVVIMQVTISGFDVSCYGFPRRHIRSLCQLRAQLAILVSYLVIECTITKVMSTMLW